MVKHKVLLSFLSAIVIVGTILFNSSCANIGAPTGGPKDSLAPEVLVIKPENFSTAFSSSKIVIEFNEYIKTANINSQLIVSPPLKNKPETLVKGESLIVKISDTLRSNTTYTFNFGNSIVDITENNPIENFKYVFSTGSYIDSLSIKGRIINAFSEKPEADALAILYLANDSIDNDSLPYKELPSYFAKANEQGLFEINNLAPNNYILFALKDGNSNLRYDLPTESIGFLSKPISITQTTDSIYNILSFTEALPFKFFNARQVGQGKIAFAFNQPSDSVSVKALSSSGLGKKAWEIISYPKEKDTLYYWTQEPLKDSVIFLISNASKAVDTAIVEIDNSYKAPKLIIKNSLANTLDINDSLVIYTSLPSLEQNSNKFILIENQTDTIVTTINSFNGFTSHTLKFTRKLGAQYSLTMLPNAFTSIFGSKNDTSIYSFRTPKADSYGSLLIQYTHKGNYQSIIQLLDDKGNAVEEFITNSSKKITLSNLLPKAYQIRIIEDKNGNGKWDTGNYLKNKQPEKVSVYGEPIIIRANWDVDISIEAPTP